MDNIRKLIREQIESLFEDFRYGYNGDFIPSSELSSNVSKNFQIINDNNLKKNDSNSNEGSGKSKAKSLINKEPMTHSQLKRMKAFFDNNEKEYKSELAKGLNVTNSPIIQSWELWGGNVGKNWCEKMLSQRKSSNNTSKTVR